MTKARDARNYILVGDPAVRIATAQADSEKLLTAGAT